MGEFAHPSFTVHKQENVTKLAGRFPVSPTTVATILAGYMFIVEKNIYVAALLGALAIFAYEWKESPY